MVCMKTGLPRVLSMAMNKTTTLFLGVVLLLFMSHAAQATSEPLHRGVGPEPDALDIHLAQSLSAFNVLRDLHEGLLTFDAEGQLIPGLAQHWTVDITGRLWTFELNPDAKWSDGTPIEASDFVAGWQRAIDPMTGSPTAGLLEPVKNAAAIRVGELPPDALGVEALDRHTLIVTLEQATPWFEELLTHPVMAPWPGEAPLFSGAYRLAERLPGAHMRLEKNTHHHQAAAVAIEEVYWHVIEEPNVELARFRADQLHITETIPPGRVEWLRNEVGDALRIAPYLGTFFLAYNVARPPFAAQPELREALSLVIDRSLLTTRVLGAGEVPAYALVPPSLPGWGASTPQWANESMDARIARAQKLYEAAGYSEDKPLVVELRYNTSLTHRRMAAAVGAMWKEHLGVQTRLVNEEWKVFVANRRQGRITQVIRGGWIGDWQDPANFLQLFVSGSPLNYTFWSNASFDALMSQSAGQAGAERMATLKEAEALLLNQHVIIPLYYYVSRHLVKPEVTGYENNLMDIHLTRWLALE